MKFFISFCFLTFLSSVTFAKTGLTANEEYKDALKNYAKAILIEACYAQKGGCKGSKKKRIDEVLIDKSYIGEYSHKKTIYYYIVMPMERVGSVTLMFERKSKEGILQYCGLTESITPFVEEKENIQRLEYNICLPEF